MMTGRTFAARLLTDDQDGDTHGRRTWYHRRPDVVAPDNRTRFPNVWQTVDEREQWPLPSHTCRQPFRTIPTTPTPPTRLFLVWTWRFPRVKTTRYLPIGRTFFPGHTTAILDGASWQFHRKTWRWIQTMDTGLAAGRADEFFALAGSNFAYLAAINW